MKKLLRFIRFSFYSRKTKTLNIIYKDGQTIIFSTHNLHVAEKISDKVIFLRNGEVISKGPISKYNELGLYETFQRLYLEFMFKNEIK